MHWSQLGAWLSKFHAIMIHFPIALIMVAGVAEAIGVFRPNSFGRVAARFCIWMALFGAIGAGVTGWLKVTVGPYAAAVPDDVSRHRWAGTVSAVAILVAVVTAEWAARRQHWMSRSVHVAGVLLAIGCVGFTGHLGGALVYGDNFLAFEPDQVTSATSP